MATHWVNLYPTRVAKKDYFTKFSSQEQESNHKELSLGYWLTYYLREVTGYRDLELWVVW
jgi:hypothetical protein